MDNYTYFHHKLGQMLYSDDFNRFNPLVRILKLASLEITELAQDPSFFQHAF